MRGCYEYIYLHVHERRRHPERQQWVGSPRLEKVTTTYPKNFWVWSDTCRSLTLEHRLVAGPARGTTGQNTTFSANKNGKPKAAAVIRVVADYAFLRLVIPTRPSRLPIWNATNCWLMTSGSNCLMLTFSRFDMYLIKLRPQNNLVFVESTVQVLAYKAPWQSQQE